MSSGSKEKVNYNRKRIEKGKQDKTNQGNFINEESSHIITVDKSD